MKKQERGTFEAFSDGMIALSQWNDNKLVCVVSNFTKAEPTIMVQRWSASKKRAVWIPQPPMLANYNKYIGKLISLIGFLVIIGHVYEARSGGDAFSNFLYISVVATWRLHKEIGGTMPHLLFRRDVVQTLMARLRDKPLRPGPSKIPVDRVRLTVTLQDGASAGEQDRCKHCKQDTRSMSKLCDFLLHPYCADEFHIY